MAFDKALTEKLFSEERTLANINEIMEANVGLVYAQLATFNVGCNDNAESYALEGLYRAVINYNVGGGVAFSTFAIVCIRNAIRQVLRSDTRNQQCYSLQELMEMYGDTVYNNRELVTEMKQGIDEGCIRDIVEKLFTSETPSAKRVLRIWIDEDYSIKTSELAIMLDCSQAYVSTIINRFRRKLARKLKEV